MKDGIIIYPGMMLSMPNTTYYNIIEGVTDKAVMFSNGDRYTPQQVAHNLKCGKWKEIHDENMEQ